MVKLLDEFAPSPVKRDRLAGWYLAAVFFVHPLVLHDGYFDITETKQVCFVSLTALFLLVFLAAALCRKKPGRPEALTGGDVCMLAFSGLLLASSLLSGSFGQTLLAANNRYQGVLTFFLYGSVYFALSRRSGFSRWTLLAMLSSFFLVTALASLNHWGLDPLGVMGELIPFDQGRYVSTIGNINFFGAYICLFVPVCMVLLCCAEKKSSRWLLSALSVLGVFGAMASKSEGAVLGLGAALILLPLILRRQPDALRRLPLLLPLLAAAMQLFRLLSLAAGGDGFSTLTALLLHPAAALAMGLLGAGLYAHTRRASDKELLRLRWWYMLLLLGLLAALVLVLLLMNTVFAQAELGPISDFLVVDSDWGTDRGKVWRACFGRWLYLPWWQQIIGGGPGCLARMDALDPVFQDAILDAAHSEFLHYLLTNGVLGLGAYLGLLFFLFRDALREGSAVTLALLSGAVGYLAQSAVNIAQPMTTPLFFVILAILAGRRPRRGK